MKHEGNVLPVDWLIGPSFLTAASALGLALDL